LSFGAKEKWQKRTAALQWQNPSFQRIWQNDGTLK
jgi:hypothetical protein